MKLREILLFALGVIWLLALPIGVSRLLIYDNQPGVSANAPLAWPSKTSVLREAGKFNLVLFLHPQCPCSRATLDNLEAMMPDLADRVQVDVFFYKPSRQPASWVKTSLWNKSAHISGVHTHMDVDGLEAEHFDSTTSGQALLYSASGIRLFEGGLTSRRGLRGTSQGADAVLSLAKDSQADSPGTPVFGCALSHPERAVATGSTL